MTVVLCFTGGIASGKTSLASAVAQRFSTPHASFGRFVRETALARGIPEEREKLQALGEALIEELGWDRFCSEVLRGAGWKPGAPAFIDGIRHVRALETLQRIVAPLPAKLVFVEVEAEIRQTRAAERAQETSDLAKAATHSTEREVGGALRARADLVLDGTKGISALVDEVQARFGL